MSNKKQLSTRQENILRFIWERMQQESRPPTIREIGGALNISSTSVVNYNLSRLEEKGLLERDKTVSRGLRLTDASYERLGEAIAAVQSMLRIPILGNIVASEPVEAGNENFTTYDEDDIVEIGSSMLSGRSQNLFALRVKGNSMVDDMINDGDIVVMKPQITAQDGEMIAAWVTGEGTTLKRIYREDNRIRLQPSNPYMDPIYAAPGDVQVQGKVMLVLRNTA